MYWETGFFISCKLMLEGIEIRKATIADLSALEEVGERLFDQPIKRNRAIEFLNDARHHLFVAICNGEIIGMASALHHVHPDKDAALFIDEVGVLEAFQGKGIGSELVRQLSQYGKELGCQVAWVVTEVENRAARKAYVNAGGIENNGRFVLIEFEM